VPPEPVLLAILAGVFLVNVVVVGVMPLARVGRRRSLRAVRGPTAEQGWPSVPIPPPVTPEPSRSLADRLDGIRSDEDARVASAIEAFVAQVPADARGAARMPAPSLVIAGGVGADASSADIDATPPVERPDPGWTPAGVADRASWDRSVREESARLARFGRPVAVVMAELSHLEDLADRLGDDVADRVAAETATLLIRHGRAADRVAWLRDATFGILLLETEESGARAYTDRIRAVADSWLESAGLSVRLAFGWASPDDEPDVRAAATSAQQRLRDDQSRRSTSAVARG
jgi:diguanylate cyclase (GGDEF)-like protein